MTAVLSLLLAPSTPRRPRPPRVRLARWCLPLVIGGALLGGACGDSDPEPAPAPVPDAGPSCERGTLGCVCVGGSGCQDDLLCIAGRCLENQDGPDEPITQPPQGVPDDPRPPQPEPDAGEAETPAPDAGSGGGDLDASVPDAAAG